MSRAESSVFSLLLKTGSDGDVRTDFGTLFQTDAAAAGKTQLSIVAQGGTWSDER